MKRKFAKILFEEMTRRLAEFNPPFARVPKPAQSADGYLYAADFHGARLFLDFVLSDHDEAFGAELSWSALGGRFRVEEHAPGRDFWRIKPPPLPTMTRRQARDIGRDFNNRWTDALVREQSPALVADFLSVLKDKALPEAYRHMR
jgi:hypothetical protein